MSNLTVAATFTRNTGAPATGLTLAEIDFYLTAHNRSTGADIVIWNGTQNPTEEIDNCGTYARIYADADLDTYDYFARASYTGSVSLDTDHVMGATDGLSPWDFGTRTLTQSAASVTAAVSGSVLTILRGDTWTASITGLGDISNYSALWFTVKRDRNDADSASILQVLLSSPAAGTDGLQYLNGASATASQGSIAVDDASAGDVTITVDEAATAQLIDQACVYDIQVLRSTGAVNTLSEGECDINADVTRATS